MTGGCRWRLSAAEVQVQGGHNPERRHVASAFQDRGRPSDAQVVRVGPPKVLHYCVPGGEEEGERTFFPSRNEYRGREWAAPVRGSDSVRTGLLGSSVDSDWRWAGPCAG
ncbi:hypothetical protein NDU88_007771, partial [Pleurodeles waltl]